MITENLRRDARIAVCVPVVIVRNKQTLSHETVDVSFRGLFIKTTEPPALRSLVRLRVALPMRTIEAHAMAVHVVEPNGERDGGVGLQFWGLAGPDRQAWDDFVRALVAARRPPAKQAASSSHPANGEPPTASGIRMVASIPPGSPRASSK